MRYDEVTASSPGTVMPARTITLVIAIVIASLTAEQAPAETMQQRLLLQQRMRARQIEMERQRALEADRQRQLQLDRQQSRQQQQAQTQQNSQAWEWCRNQGGNVATDLRI